MDTLDATDESRDAAIDVLFGQLAATRAVLDAVICHLAKTNPGALSDLAATVADHLSVYRDSVVERGGLQEQQYLQTAGATLQQLELLSEAP
jgi:hypothetical protein